jgi:riboflavin kinase
MLAISGEVASGLGKGAYFIGIDWVQSSLSQLMGAQPYPGTLNICIAKELCNQLFAMRTCFSPLAAPGATECSAYVVSVVLRTQQELELDAWAVLPDATVHADILEIVSPHFLREHLALKNGDKLHLRVNI